ncbi:histone deacetylase [Candidatus Calescamantes bacterium]|nr:histone deacetylase [Candidatus Calescamantes bacterium]
MGLRIFYHPEYYADIGEHVFPMEKYGLIVERLKSEGLVKEEEIITPYFPQNEDILLVHTREYLEKVKNISLSYRELMILEIPLTEQVVTAFYWHVGGTISALQIALERGVGINVGGGFHHAFPDHGEGFCLFNDIAISLKKGLEGKWFEKAIIVDCDLHQGNGNAFIFRDEERVFTLSIHQERNYPFPKMKSDLDIGLEDGTGDEEYLRLLGEALPSILDEFKPQVLFYIAGADPFKEDVLGGLRLSKGGLRRRDELVKEEANKRGIASVVTLGGGYAQKLEDTVDIHFQTIKVFLEK